jgi:hypothetical protein
MSWIQPTSKSGMHVFTCDYDGYPCGDNVRGADGRSQVFTRTEFRSASIKSVLAKQLLLAGWTIAIRPGHGRPVETFVESLSGKRDRIYLCPKHNPRGAAKPGGRMGDAGPNMGVKIAT